MALYALLVVANQKYAAALPAAHALLQQVHGLIPGLDVREVALALNTELASVVAAQGGHVPVVTQVNYNIRLPVCDVAANPQ
jgi:hypothetical protein